MRRFLPACLALACLAAPLACTEETIVKAAPLPPASENVDEEEVEPTPEPDASSPPAGDPLLVDLGSFATGEDLSFEVPDGALGFNIVAESSIKDFNQNKPFGVERITDPSGKVVHDDFTPKGGSKPTSFASFDAMASASFPQGDAPPAVLPAGTWKVRFGLLDGGAAVRLKAKVRIQSSGDGVFHGGALTLHVHVPAGLMIQGQAVDPKKASTDPRLKERLDLFFGLTEELLGIERGDVVFHEERASLAELDDNEILDGFSVSAGEKDGTPALHVMMTNAIRFDGEPVAAGISPGIPGAANVFGRNVSGIIVVPYLDAEQDTLTMLHEAGHFFGLNHTTEFDGESADPLSDTPRCTDIAGGQFELCPDVENVMFPTGAMGSRAALSPTQKRVYRGSPIYKATPADAKKTQSLATHAPIPNLRRRFRVSGRALSPVESELSLGFCGLSPLDASGLVKRHGPAAVVQLRAAASDDDLAPVIRGRARLALRRLGS